MPSPQPARAAAWALVLLALLGAERLTASEPAGFRMLGILEAVLFSLKAVVSVEERIATGVTLSPLRWLAFAAAWPGMRLHPQQNERKMPQRKEYSLTVLEYS